MYQLHERLKTTQHLWGWDNSNLDRRFLASDLVRHTVIGPLSYFTPSPLLLQTSFSWGLQQPAATTMTATTVTTPRPYRVSICYIRPDLIVFPPLLHHILILSSSRSRHFFTFSCIVRRYPAQIASSLQHRGPVMSVLHRVTCMYRTSPSMSSKPEK